MIIRPLRAVERELVRKFYLALSRDDRRMRFCSVASDETVNGYVDKLDFTRTSVLAAYDEHAEIIGLGELAPVADGGEMAFAVRTDMRGRGVATCLMKRLLNRARTCGLHEVYVMFLPENTPMRKLALGARMSITTEDAVSYARRALDAPSAAELALWCTENMVSHGEHFLTVLIAGWDSVLKNAASTSALPVDVPHRFEALSRVPEITVSTFGDEYESALRKTARREAGCVI